ncbi:cupin domain-containing protein [Edaphobacter sp. HDX4]
MKPGENRFDYAVAELKKSAGCKVTKEDSLGACSIFELVNPPKGGPPRHIHHREDEWYYVLSSEFLFEVGNVKYTLPVGGSICAPRDIPHVLANVGTTEGRIILMCIPRIRELLRRECKGTHGQDERRRYECDCD